MSIKILSKSISQAENNLVISNTLNFSNQNTKYLRSNHNPLEISSHSYFQTYTKYRQVKHMPLQTLIQSFTHINHS